MKYGLEDIIHNYLLSSSKIIVSKITVNSDKQEIEKNVSRIDQQKRFQLTLISKNNKLDSSNDLVLIEVTNQSLTVRHLLRSERRLTADVCHRI